MHKGGRRATPGVPTGLGVRRAPEETLPTGCGGSAEMRPQAVKGRPRREDEAGGGISPISGWRIASGSSMVGEWN
jgi:hypothetical protein